MVNPASLMTVMNAWKTFQEGHPKFPAFLGAVNRNGIKEGTVIEIAITDPDGTKIETNIKVSATDLELFNTLKQMN